ncbi:MAG: hypothetical protein ACREE9_19210 [Stellaceae bacterium]
MKQLLLGLATLPFVAGVAFAAQPLTDNQMDKVTAGHTLTLLETTDVSVIGIRVGVAPVTPPASAGLLVGNVVLPLTTIQVWWTAVP